MSEPALLDPAAARAAKALFAFQCGLVLVYLWA